MGTTGTQPITATVTSQLLKTRGAAVYLLLLLTTPLWIAGAIRGAWLASNSPDPGLLVEPDGTLARVDPARWPALASGDRVVAIDGAAVAPAEVDARIDGHAHGALALVVVRDGKRVAARGEILARPLAYRIAVAVRVGSGAASMLIGLVAFLIRPGVIVTWLFLFFCYDVGASLLALVAFLDPNVSMRVVLGGFALGSSLAVHLFSLFPAAAEPLRRRPVAAVALYVPAVALLPIVLAAPYDSTLFGRAATVIYLLVGASALVVTAIMLWLYRRERRRGAPETLPQYRLVILAVVGGLAVPAIWNLLRQVFGLWAARYVVHWNTLPILFFVALTAYALVRHNVLSGDRIALAIVGYALTLSLMALGLVALVGVGAGAALLVGGRPLFQSPAVLIATTAVVILGAQPLDRALKRRIDRRFSREELDPQRSAEALAHLARGTQGASRETALQLAVDTLRMLGGDLVELWAVDDDGAFGRRKVLGVPPEGASSKISRDGALGLALLARLSGGVAGVATTPLPAAAAAELWAHGLALAAPVVAHGILAGFVAVGRKRSGARLGPAELAFLTAVAGQVGVVLERSTDEGSSFGRYRIERRLGVGGMAEVFLAWQLGPGGFERRVALKRPLPTLAEDPDAVALFLDEARVAAELHHPNIAHVYEVDRHAGTYFIAMELVDGPSLRSLIRAARETPPSVAVAAGIVHQILAGLGHAHGHTRDGRPLAVVHRDVTPANVLVSKSGEAKIVDFGIARSAARLQVTRTGTVRGTVTYMAPEQSAGGEVDRRTDLFMVGELLYELVTLTPPFPHGPMREVYVPASVRNPLVSAEVDAFLTRALRFDPAARYPSAERMQEALVAALAPAAIASPVEIAVWVESLRIAPPPPPIAVEETV